MKILKHVKYRVGKANIGEILVERKYKPEDIDGLIVVATKRNNYNRTPIKKK